VFQHGSRVVFATNLVRNKIFGLHCKGTRAVVFSDIESSCQYPLLLQLLSSENSVDPCVTMFQGIIFDSSLDHPMRFSRSALNLCSGIENSNVCQM
jgi:hypothetical protein